MKIYLLVFLLLYSNISFSSWENTILEIVNGIPQKESGHLKCKTTGYCYLKVDDNYIYEINNAIKNQESLKELKKFSIPPYFRTKDAPGAHISIFYENEWEKNKFLKLKEINQKFIFKHQNVEIVQNKNKKFLVLKVQSEELEKLREKYNKSKLLNNHPFHITLAEQEI